MRVEFLRQYDHVFAGTGAMRTYEPGPADVPEEVAERAIAKGRAVSREDKPKRTRRKASKSKAPAPEPVSEPAAQPDPENADDGA